MLTSRNLCTKSEREKNWIKQDLMKLVKVHLVLCELCFCAKSNCKVGLLACTKSIQGTT